MITPSSLQVFATRSSGSDVTARGLTNAYAQTLAGVFPTESKPFEVELVVAEPDPHGVGRLARQDCHPAAPFRRRLRGYQVPAGVEGERDQDGALALDQVVAGR